MFDYWEWSDCFGMLVKQWIKCCSSIILLCFSYFFALIYYTWCIFFSILGLYVRIFMNIWLIDIIYRLSPHTLTVSMTVLAHPFNCIYGGHQNNRHSYYHFTAWKLQFWFNSVWFRLFFIVHVHGDIGGGDMFCHIFCFAWNCLFNNSREIIGRF